MSPSVISKYEFVCEQAKFWHFLDNKWATSAFGQIFYHVLAKFLQIWANLCMCFGQIHTFPNWFRQFRTCSNVKREHWM